MVKSVFKALHNLNDQGFNTWVTRLCELASYYKIDYNAADSLSPEQFKLGSTEIIKTDYKNRWMFSIYHVQSTRMMTYAPYKTNFNTEKYLDLIPVVKHRVSLTKLRTSSHNLEIGRGRYVRPRVKPEQRRCVVCNVMDDEIHFVTQCPINAGERRMFYQKMFSADPKFTSSNDKEKCIYLMQSNEQETTWWFAKYIYKSFHTRNELIYNACK